MTDLNTQGNIADPDGFYAELLGAHEGLSDDESATINARRVQACPQGKFAATSTNLRRPWLRQLATMVRSSSGMFRERASHIWIGLPSSERRRFSSSTRFSPACLRP